MKKAVIHFVQHRCGPQECDCSPRCHAREGDEIVTSSSVAAVTCKNCLKGLKKDRHPDLPKLETVDEQLAQLKAEIARSTQREIHQLAEIEALRKYGEEFAVLAERRREEVEALRKDAERYRWLKDKHQDVDSDIGVYDGANILRTEAAIYDLHLDLSIDRLMRKEASHD